MKQFYLAKNQHGYYRVDFIDPVTGLQGSGKSTHSKNRDEAMRIAYNWLYNGSPEARSNSRNFNTSDSIKIPVNIKSFVDNLSEDDAKTVLDLITRKFNLYLEAPSTPSPVKTVITETVPSVEGEQTPRPKKIFVVRKKPVQTPVVVAVENKHLLCDTLDNFWDYENSEYIKRTLAHGHSISKKHAFCMRSFVRNYWRPYFGDDLCNKCFKTLLAHHSPRRGYFSL